MGIASGEIVDVVSMSETKTGWPLSSFARTSMMRAPDTRLILPQGNVVG